MNTRSTQKIWRALAQDLLLTAVILGMYALLWITPIWLRSPEGEPRRSAFSPAASIVVGTPDPSAVRGSRVPEGGSGRTVPVTPWQVQFADRFTPEIQKSETAYSSPEVAISLSTRTLEHEGRRAVYHVADIYIASIENFGAYTANGEMRYLSVQDVMEMDAASGALLCISGDFYSYQTGGFLVRNGETYMAEPPGGDICVLYRDGRMVNYSPGEYDPRTILAEDPWQVWSFGPSLLDENGKARDSFEVNLGIRYPNPRSAMGYYEPGHYCFVVADGRQPGYSDGMTLEELAGVFEELGCASAYNLDGGGSAVMVYDHERYSRQSNGGERELGDIVLIREREEIR